MGPCERAGGGTRLGIREAVVAEEVGGSLARSDRLAGVVDGTLVVEEVDGRDQRTKDRCCRQGGRDPEDDGRRDPRGVLCRRSEMGWSS